MVSKFKTRINFLHYKPVYNGHNAHKGITNEKKQMLPRVIKPVCTSAKLEC